MSKPLPEKPFPPANRSRDAFAGAPVLRTGSVSTVDVINGVKALLPKLKETLPASLKLDTINDQGPFVSAASAFLRQSRVGFSAGHASRPARGGRGDNERPARQASPLRGLRFLAQAQGAGRFVRSPRAGDIDPLR